MFYFLRKSFEYLYSPRFQSGIESKKIKWLMFQKKKLPTFDELNDMQ